MEHKLYVTFPNREMIMAAAIIDKNGLVYFMQPPARHHNILHALYVRFGKNMDGEQGFWTSLKRFVSRETALKIAIESKQLNDLRNKPNAYKGDQLFSEDLW